VYLLNFHCKKFLNYIANISNYFNFAEQGLLYQQLD
jgi:hypothetical protein